VSTERMSPDLESAVPSSVPGGWYRLNLSYRIFYVFLRNLISYKRFVVPTLVVSIGQPLFYLITFGIGLGAYMGAFGGKPYLHFLVPGVLISSVMLSSSFECLYGTFVKMVHERLYDSLVATPVSAEDAVAGDIAWGAFRGLIGGVLMIVVASFMGIYPASVLSVLLLVVLMIFVGVLFGSLAMIITSFAPNFDFFNYYTELVLTPMLFFSGVFFPLDRFPAWMKTFANFLPLTHAVRISRAAFGGMAGAPGGAGGVGGAGIAGAAGAGQAGGAAAVGVGGASAETASGVLLSFLILLAIEVVAFYIGIKRMKRRLIK
jgi:lipooligosaccharide transport system permease protein